ncbi:hypothetical protein SprV_0702313700 [Sparganum proliferum]
MHDCGNREILWELSVMPYLVEECRQMIHELAATVLSGERVRSGCFSAGELLHSSDDFVEGGRSTAYRNQVKSVFDGDHKGPATELASCQGHLVSAAGQKIYSWTLKNDDLIGVGFVDTDLYIHNLRCVKNLVLAADVLKLIQASMRVISVVSCDTVTREVLVTNFFVYGTKLGFLSFIVRKPRGRQIRDRRTLERFTKPLGPKIGLLNGQPITRRKIYLSGASSDSESYESPSSVEGDPASAEGPQRRQNRSRFPPPPPPSRDHDASLAIPTQTMCTNPNLFESRRPAVPIGGLTMVSFCRPHRRHRGSDLVTTNRVDRSPRGLGDGDASGSSSSGSPSAHRRGRRPGPRRVRVEYITTFGGEDDEGEGGQTTGTAGGTEQTRRASLDSPARRPLGSTASALAASVVSSMLSKPTAEHTGRARLFNRGRPRNRSTSNSSHRRRRSSEFSRRQRSSVSSSSSRSSSRRDSRRFGRSRSGSRASSTSHRRSKRVRSDSTSLSPASRRDPDRAFRNRSRSPSKKGPELSVPVKRYYRPELESDEEKSVLSALDSDSGDSQKDLSPRSGSFQRTSSSSVEPNRRRRYFNNLGESGDFFSSGGKKSLDETRSDDRFSPATHSSHTSATTTTPSTQEACLSSGNSMLKLTPQELLKRRMQAQLNKAFVADKKAEQERQMKLEKERLDREQGLRKLAEKIRQREADRRRAERLLDVGRRRWGPGGLSPDSPSRSVGGASTTSRSCSPRSPPAPPQPPRREVNKRPSPSFDRVRGYDRERFADDCRSPASSSYRGSDYTRCKRDYDDRRPNSGRGYYGRSDRYAADRPGRGPSPRRYERSRDRR